MNYGCSCSALARGSVDFLIVLKNEGQNRGYFRGSNLMSTGEFENAKAEILRSIRGIRQDPELGSGIRLANGTQLPSFYAAIDSLDALTKLRLWRTLDYVEPAFMFFDSIACGADVYVQSSDPRAEDKTVPGLGGGTDLVPYVYQFHGVQPAWARFNLPGQEQGVAVLDSGVSTQQEQFFSRYAMFNARRPHLRLKEISANQSIDDVCFHGTKKVASVAAAPRDGRSIVGIARDAPLITAKINESPLATQGSVNAICAGIMDAVKPPDGRPPARAVAMAFGLSYASDTVAECIRTAFQTSPSTVFVAAAGSNVPRVVFPANMDGFVQAVSTVELSPSGSGFRLFGRPLTVAYGPEVDFVTVNGPDGMPASGVIGNNQADQIARFKWSSAATGMYAGLVALAGQYASQRNWTRAQLISAMQQAASRNGITDFSGEPLEGAMVGWGILDVYRATGGAQIATISGVYQATGGQKVDPYRIYRCRSTVRRDAPAAHVFLLDGERYACRHGSDSHAYGTLVWRDERPTNRARPSRSEGLSGHALRADRAGRTASHLLTRVLVIIRCGLGNIFQRGTSRPSDQCRREDAPSVYSAKRPGTPLV